MDNAKSTLAQLDEPGEGDESVGHTLGSSSPRGLQDRDTANAMRACVHGWSQPLARKFWCQRGEGEGIRLRHYEPWMISSRKDRPRRGTVVLWKHAPPRTMRG